MEQGTVIISEGKKLRLLPNDTSSSLSLSVYSEDGCENVRRLAATLLPVFPAEQKNGRSLLAFF